MIEEVVSVELPVHERLVVRKNRLMNKDENHSTPRISIVTGTHGDELDGQLICYEIIRRIEREKDKLKGIVDIYPDINPLGIDTGSRGIPMFDLDMNRVLIMALWLNMWQQALLKILLEVICVLISIQVIYL